MWRLRTGSSGGVVRTLADVELVVIDFGMSYKLKLTSCLPTSSGHTKPFGTKYFLTKTQRIRLDARGSDFFQALQVVMHLAIMGGGGGKVSAAIGKQDTDFKGLGSRWLTQDKPWLAFVVTHHESSCEKLIHDIYCTPCRNLFASDSTEVADIDNCLSPLPRTLR
jgi:hypothetical protein